MTARRGAGRAGAVLLEVVVALGILSAIGLGGTGLVSQSLSAVQNTLDRERQTRAASNLLSAVWLWPVEDLDRHLGESVQGPFHLRIQRPTATLYAIQLVDGASGAPVLSTVVFRAPAP